MLFASSRFELVSKGGLVPTDQAAFIAFSVVLRLTATQGSRRQTQVQRLPADFGAKRAAISDWAVILLACVASAAQRTPSPEAAVRAL